MKRILLLGTTLSLVLACVAGLAAVAAASPPDDLQAVRAATARYHSFEQAERAGYSVAGEPCVSSPFGTMGVHAANPALIADPAIDPLRPEILVYLPDEHGKLKLVAVEYMTVALANTESGPRPWFGAAAPPLGFFTPAPTVLGSTFDGPMPGHNPTMPWHYDQHVWLWKSNPNGLFSAWNPDISCP